MGSDLDMKKYRKWLLICNSILVAVRLLITAGNALGIEPLNQKSHRNIIPQNIRDGYSNITVNEAWDLFKRQNLIV